MKFGKTLKRVMHAPWADKYVDYKSLKQCIKKVSSALEAFLITHQSIDQSINQSIDTTRLNIGRLEFFRSISSEVQKINQFYFSKLDEWEVVYQSIIQSINQSVNQSINQSINRSIINNCTERSVCDFIWLCHFRLHHYCRIGQS